MELSKLKNACVHITVRCQGETTVGTGYLIRPKWVATCEHVVRGLRLGSQATVRLYDREYPATLDRLDPENDCALLRLEKPIDDAEPLRLRSQCAKDEVWQSYGFPQVTGGAGLNLTGVVHDPAGEDTLRSPSLLLACQSVTHGAPLQGFSGSPVVIGDHVVGHLKRIIPDAQGGAMFSLVYACPARFIEALLPIDVMQSQAVVRLQAPKAAYDRRWYIERPTEERLALDYLSYPGQPVVLWGPELYGKTWLLQYLLQYEQIVDGGASQVVQINFGLFDDTTWLTLDALLCELGSQIATVLGIPAADVTAAFARSKSPMANLNWLMERTLLPSVPGRLLLAMDRLDTLLGRPYSDSFFGMLRAWAEKGHSAPWSSLRLLLSVSTTPSMFIENHSQSPFNLTDPISLGELTDSGLDRLAQLYGLVRHDRDIAQLRAHVGGHPYLARLAMYRARQLGQSLTELLGDDRSVQQVFGDYLKHCRSRLKRQAGLYESFCTLLRNPRAPLSDDTYYRLHGAGLAHRDEQTGTYSPSCALYRRLPLAL